MLPLDLFEMVYFPRYQEQLNALEEMALPEPWRFVDDTNLRQNVRNPVLSNHLRLTFRRISSAYNTADVNGWLDDMKKLCYWTSDVLCFHTGLFTVQYNAIYALISRSHNARLPNEWVFRGFLDEGSYHLMNISPLPQRLQAPRASGNYAFFADWPLRINIRHMLEDEKNYARIPEKLRNFPNLRLLLEAGVNMARKQAMVAPGRVVPHLYHAGLQYLLPICLEDSDRVDLVMTLSRGDGFYLGNTCLTPQMAYSNARLLGRPTVPWLTKLVIP